MSDESILVAIVAAIIIAISLSAKGCNDSDNAVYSAAISRGCDIRKVEHHGKQIICPPEKKTEAKP